MYLNVSSRIRRSVKIALLKSQRKCYARIFKGNFFFSSVTHGARSRYIIFTINIAVTAGRTGLRVKAPDKFHPELAITGKTWLEAPFISEIRYDPSNTFYRMYRINRILTSRINPDAEVMGLGFYQREKPRYSR